MITDLERAWGPVRGKTAVGKPSLLIVLANGVLQARLRGAPYSVPSLRDLQKGGGQLQLTLNHLLFDLQDAWAKKGGLFLNVSDVGDFEVVPYASVQGGVALRTGIARVEENSPGVPMRDVAQDLIQRARLKGVDVEHDR